MSTAQHSTYCTVWTPTSEHNVSTYISLPAVTKQVAFISHRLQREQRSSPTPSPERYRSVKLNSRTTRCKSTDKIYTEFLKLLIFCKVVSFFFASSLCPNAFESIVIPCASFRSFKSTTTSSSATWSFMSCRPETLSRVTTMATLTHLLKFIFYQGEGESRVWKLQAHVK